MSVKFKDSDLTWHENEHQSVRAAYGNSRCLVSASYERTIHCVRENANFVNQTAGGNIVTTPFSTAKQSDQVIQN